MHRELSVACWEGYDSPHLLRPFEQRHAVQVAASTLISDADAAGAIAAGDTATDVLNINNAWVAGFLHPRGLVQPLDGQVVPSEVLLPHLDSLQRWTRSLDERHTVGIIQRFGPFNLVVNERAISRATAEDQGFLLAAERSNRGRYGILLYADFNIFHICIAAGINPFVPLDPQALARFEQTAGQWFESAAMVSEDHHRLNRALVDRDIDFYLSGGIYTASPARLAGHTQVRAITPARGPIDGRGAIAFAEITCILRHARSPELAAAFLDYLQQPETALRAAITPGTCNPVAQMADPAVLGGFNREQLAAIQWDSLEEEMARCADYQLVPDGEVLRGILGEMITARQRSRPRQ